MVRLIPTKRSKLSSALSNSRGLVALPLAKLSFAVLSLSALRASARSHNIFKMSEKSLLAELSVRVKYFYFKIL